MWLKLSYGRAGYEYKSISNMENDVQIRIATPIFANPIPHTDTVSVEKDRDPFLLSDFVSVSKNYFFWCHYLVSISKNYFSGDLTNSNGSNSAPGPPFPGVGSDPVWHRCTSVHQERCCGTIFWGLPIVNSCLHKSFFSSAKCPQRQGAGPSQWTEWPKSVCLAGRTGGWSLHISLNQIYKIY